jgi:hypothetical protein
VCCVCVLCVCAARVASEVDACLGRVAVGACRCVKCFVFLFVLYFCVCTYLYHNEMAHDFVNDSLFASD